MTKYVCTVCGYVYDPATGDPDNGVAAGTNGRMSRKTGYAPFAEWERNYSRLSRPRTHKDTYCPRFNITAGGFCLSRVI